MTFLRVDAHAEEGAPLIDLRLTVVNSSDPLQGASRFLLAAIPVYLALGRWASSRPLAHTALLAVGLLAQAAVVQRFFAGLWAT